MKKLCILLVILAIVFPLISAINLKVEIQSSDEVMVPNINDPAVFELKITNLGESDTFKFYNLLGFEMLPREAIFISGGLSKTIQLMVFPKENFDTRGFFSMQYNIRAQDGSEITEKLRVKIINLENMFEIGSDEFDPESNSINVFVQNKENFNFNEIDAKFSSTFFNFKEKFSLNPNERKEFDVELNKEDFKKVTAGFYTLNADFEVDGEEIKIEGKIEFLEKNIVTTTKRDYGLVISTKTIIKSNEGNVASKSETVMKKNIISRLFTSFDPEPEIVERKGLGIQYTWNRIIQPGEDLKIVVKTNWLFPFLVLFFIFTIVILVKKYSDSDLQMRKRVRFVKAKGGEFALNVSIIIKAKSYIERINIIDRLPPLVKVFERFGSTPPTKVDEKNRRIEWRFEKMEAGETRVLSYTVYSKVGVLGRFALPAATAIFEKNGELSETESNRAFFVTEQRSDY